MLEASEPVAGVHRALNFEVATTHTYYAGDDDAWVHNACFEDSAKHALGNGRLGGKAALEAASYLDNLAASTLGNRTADGATVWRRGAEVLIQRSDGYGVGTYFVADSEKAAAAYVARMIEREGGSVALVYPR